MGVARGRSPFAGVWGVPQIYHSSFPGQEEGLGMVGKGVAERSLIRSLALTVDTVAFML